ncbi:MAG: 3-phosphoshikimate 1-carboxyvinyltransferase, partial [Candidatus Omnitrophica bacterium]|nr:3-phosphoshikimate 1-carboxyvinyltransferase [Candidatus Omnitrophota bacterium]
MSCASLSRQQNLRLTAALSGDKSISHRAMILAALAEGESRIDNYLESGDCLATARIFRSLGARVRRVARGSFRVKGVGMRGLKTPGTDLDCGNSGTTMRLLSGLLAGAGIRARLFGDASLSRRPMDRVVLPLERMGARLQGSGKRHLPPLRILPSELSGIRFRLPVASAQVKSAVLLAALWAHGETTVIEPVPTRDHTERFFKYLKIPIRVAEGRIRVRSVGRIHRFGVRVPGDPSAAAFLAAMGALVPGSRIEIKDMLWNPGRTGFFTALERMGAKLRVKKISVSGPEPTATVSVAASALSALTLRKRDVPSMIDEFPILMVMATQARGRSRFRGLGELRVKETDRIASMVTQLSAMGARIGAEGDDVWVEGPTPLKGRTLT